MTILTRSGNRVTEQSAATKGVAIRTYDGLIDLDTLLHDGPFLFVPDGWRIVSPPPLPEQGTHWSGVFDTFKAGKFVYTLPLVPFIGTQEMAPTLVGTFKGFATLDEWFIRRGCHLFPVKNDERYRACWYWHTPSVG